MLLRRLPLEGIAIYWGSLTAAKEVQFEPGNLIDKLSNRELRSVAQQKVNASHQQGHDPIISIFI